MLIAPRAVLGLAGATLAPSTLSLIRNMFLDPRERTLAIGVWVTSFSVGAAIGPLVGGLLLERFGWGSVFLLGVPVMLLLLVARPAASAGVPRSRRRPARSRERRPLARRPCCCRSSGSSGSPRAALGWLPALSIAGGARHRVRLRAPAATAGRAADRPEAVPRARRSARRSSATRSRPSSCSAPSCSSPSTCSSCSASHRSRRGCGRCRSRSAFIVGSLLAPAVVRHGSARPS